MKTRIAFVPQISSLPSSGGLVLSNLSLWHRARKFAFLAAAPLAALLFSSSAFAQSINVAGQLLIDLSATRGLTTNTTLNAGETNVTVWSNFGILGGEFDAASTSVYAIAGILPPAMTNYAGILAPASPNGRMMVANFNTPGNLQGHVPYSVECWFYEVSFSASPDGVFGWTLAAPPSGDAGIFSAANIAADANDGNSLNWAASGASPTLGAWHYGVLTYDGTTESAYLDGVLSNSAPRNLNFVAVNASAVVGNPSLFSYLLAIPATSASSRFNGAIASLRVHTDALSAADVAHNFAAGASAVPAPVNLSIAITNVTAITGTPGTPNSGAATFNAVIQSTLSPSTTSLTFLYDTVDHGRTTNGWAKSVTLPAPQNLGPVFASVTGLTNGATYYVRAYTTDSADTNLSAAVSFITQGAPSIVNSGAFFNGPTQETLLGNLTSDGTGGGGAYITVYWGTNNGGTNAASWAFSATVGTSLVGQFQAAITGLTTLSNYYFTSQATNQYGTNWATPSIAFQEGAIVVLNTTNLPAASLPPAAATTVTNYPSQYGAAIVAAVVNQAPGTPQVQDFGGVPWLSTPNSGGAAENLYLPPSSFPNGAPAGIPANGGTVIAAIRPTARGSTSGWSDIAAVYFSQLGLAASSSTTTTLGGSVASVTVTNGGTGYTSAPTVTFAAPGGTPALDSAATGTAQISGAGVVTNVIITSGGTGYTTFTGTAVGDIPPPAVSFTGGGGSGAAGTAVMTANTGAFRIFGDVNTSTPNTAAATAIYVPTNKVSILSLVAGSGATSGSPGDNNYLLYVNGIKVVDTDFGYITAVTFTNAGLTNGFGYTSAPTVTFSAPTAPGGTTATGVAVMGTTTNTGHIASITITSPGSGYTGNGTSIGANNVTVTFTGGGASTPAVGIATGVNFGLYSAVAGAFGAPTIGYNGGNMTALKFNAETYSPDGTICIGQDDLTIDNWSGFTGYIGDVYIYGEAISDTARQALEAQMAGKFVTAATLSYNITSSTTGAGSGTITAPGQNGSGVTSVVQGNPLTYTITPSAGGSAIGNVTVDGVSVGTVFSYTFPNVSATHTISVNFVVVPAQTITSSVTGSVGGNITPLGLVNVAGGGTQFFSIQPSNGFVVTTLTVDGTNITSPLGTTPFNGTLGITNPGYTFANLGGNGSGPAHTIVVTFAALSGPEGPSVPKSDQLIFSLSTGSLPTTNAGPITNWSVYAPSSIPALIVRENTPTTFLDANNTIWEKNIELNDNTTETEMQIGATTGTTVTPIPVNGATIVVAANPTRQTTPNIAWNQIVSFFYNDLVLGIRNDNGAIQVIENQTPYNSIANPNPAPYSVPTGSNVVLSLVVQPSGAFAVYANTVMVFTNAGNGAFTSLHNAVSATFGNNIEIGGDGTDLWPNFNGLIGDVFAYGIALTNGDRNTLEAALMTKFHAVVPPNYNWNGASNANWSSLTSWSNTIPLAVSTVPNGAGIFPTFSLTNTSGQTVQVDQPGFTVGGLIFNTNVPNITIASTSANALTLDSGSLGTSPSITVSSNASPTISDALNVQEGLTINGPGNVTLSGNVTTGDAGAGAIGANLTSGLLVVSGGLTLSSNVTIGGTIGSTTVAGYLSMAHGATTATVTQTGGTVTTFTLGEDWTGSGYGPGVGLGGYNNAASSATYNLNGGILLVPDIGCVTSTGSSLVPPSTYGATAVLNLNGGILQAAGNDLIAAVNATAVTEGSDHLIFNTTHTWVNAGGAIINTGGYTVSIAVPLEHYPSGPDIDGGLTVMGAGGFLTNLSTATYTGTTRVESGTLVCMLTNSIGGNVVDIDDGGVLNLNFTGTTKVYVLTLNEGSALPAGTYGATGSGATTIDNTHFSGTGTVTVLGTLTNPEKPSFTSTLFSGSVVGGTGSITLSGTGGIPGGTFEVIGSTNASIPVTNWTTIATGTFSASGFSISVPVTTNVPQEFLKVVAP